MNNIYKVVLAFCIATTLSLLFLTPTFAQSISINDDGSSPNPKAILDVKSISKGLLIPRMTTVQRTGMGAGMTELGMMVYDTNLKNYMFYTGGDWVPVGEGASLWETYSSYGLRSKLNKNVGIGVIPLSNTKLNIDAGAQRGLQIRNSGGTTNFALKVSNTVGTAARFSVGGDASGYPATPTALSAIGLGNNMGIFAVSNGTAAGLLAQSKGTGPALDAWSFGTGLAGLFRNGDVSVFGGNMGIGTMTPSNRLQVEGESGTAAHVVVSNVNFTGNIDARAFSGVSVTNPGYGYGGHFTGGYKGVYGYNNGGNYAGTSMGVEGLAVATGSVGTRIGVYGSASGGEQNWGGYFLGNTYVSGNLRVGNTTGAAGYRLSIDGKIMAEEIRVQNSSAWPDYVFADDYDLKSLSELKKFIQKESHLPGIPSASEIDENGITLGAMQNKMMEKIEELTLHLIEMSEEMNQLKKELTKIKENK